MNEPRRTNGAFGVNEAQFLRLIRSETRGPVATLARSSLAFLARRYGLGDSLRNAGFDRGSKPVHRVDLPVISIGNLTLGGTGKTPMVEWVARGGSGKRTSESQS